MSKVQIITYWTEIEGCRILFSLWHALQTLSYAFNINYFRYRLLCWQSGQGATIDFFQSLELFSPIAFSCLDFASDERWLAHLVSFVTGFGAIAIVSFWKLVPSFLKEVGLFRSFIHAMVVIVFRKLIWICISCFARRGWKLWITKSIHEKCFCHVDWKPIFTVNSFEPNRARLRLIMEFEKRAWIWWKSLYVSESLKV